MTTSQATMLGVATFLVAFVLCLVHFAVLDIKALYLIGPGIATAAGGYVTYTSALTERPGSRTA